MLPLAALAAVFGLVPGAAVPADGQICPLAGCESQVVVSLRSVPRVAQAPFGRVRVCAAGTCTVTPARSRGAHHPVPNVQGPQPVKVAVTFTTRSGTPLWRRTRAATLRRSQPNGPDCPPVCWTGRLVVRDGRLADG